MPYSHDSPAKAGAQGCTPAARPGPPLSRGNQVVWLTRTVSLVRPLVSLRRRLRAGDAGHALLRQQPAQHAVGPAEAVLARIFAAAAFARGLDHVVLLHELAGAAVGVDHGADPARRDRPRQPALAIVGKPLHRDPLQRCPAVRRLPLLAPV